jgi:hypothetical protein
VEVERAPAPSGARALRLLAQALADERTRLLQCVGGFRQERPEDVEDVCLGRRDLDPRVDAMGLRTLGQSLRLVEDVIARRRLDEQWRFIGSADTARARAGRRR